MTSFLETQSEIWTLETTFSQHFLCAPFFGTGLICHFRFQIDDPLDAIPVHGAGGIWGILAVYLFKWEGIFLTGSKAAALGLAWNIVGTLGKKMPIELSMPRFSNSLQSITLILEVCKV